MTCDVRQIVAVRLGMHEDTPVAEVTAELTARMDARTKPAKGVGISDTELLAQVFGQSTPLDELDADDAVLLHAIEAAATGQTVQQPASADTDALDEQVAQVLGHARARSR